LLSWHLDCRSCISGTQRCVVYRSSIVASKYHDSKCQSPLLGPGKLLDICRYATIHWKLTFFPNFRVSTLTFNTISSPQICYPAILIVAVVGTSRCVVCRSSIVAQNTLLVNRNFTVASAAIRKTFGCSLLSDSLSEIFFPNSKTSILTFDRSSSPAICLRQRFQRRCSETRYASESSSSFP
jgi:hypothetical protein